MDALPADLVCHAADYLALADLARLQTTCRRMLGALAGARLQWVRAVVHMERASWRVDALRAGIRRRSASFPPSMWHVGALQMAVNTNAPPADWRALLAEAPRLALTDNEPWILHAFTVEHFAAALRLARDRPDRYQATLWCPAPAGAPFAFEHDIGLRVRFEASEMHVMAQWRWFTPHANVNRNVGDILRSLNDVDPYVVGAVMRVFPQVKELLGAVVQSQSVKR